MGIVSIGMGEWVEGGVSSQEVTKARNHFHWSIWVLKQEEGKRGQAAGSDAVSALGQCPTRLSSIMNHLYLKFKQLQNFHLK